MRATSTLAASYTSIVAGRQSALTPWIVGLAAVVVLASGCVAGDDGGSASVSIPEVDDAPVESGPPLPAEAVAEMEPSCTDAISALRPPAEDLSAALLAWSEAVRYDRPVSEAMGDALDAAQAMQGELDTFVQSLGEVPLSGPDPSTAEVYERYVADHQVLRDVLDGFETNNVGDFGSAKAAFEQVSTRLLAVQDEKVDRLGAAACATFRETMTREPASPESAIDEHGDDADLDDLAAGCFDGDMSACDRLSGDSNIASGYRRYANHCGGRLLFDPPDPCVEVLDAG